MNGFEARLAHQVGELEQRTLQLGDTKHLLEMRIQNI